MPSNLEAVLDQVLDEVSRGAHPWTLPPGVVKELRKRYEPGFKKALASPDYWVQYGRKVLRMARCAGAYGSFFAESADSTAAPGSVRLPHMLMAMGIVKIWCVTRKRSSAKAMGESEFKTLGKPCEGMNIEEGVKPLKAFLQDTIDELPEDVAPAAAAKRRRLSGARRR